MATPAFDLCMHVRGPAPLLLPLVHTVLVCCWSARCLPPAVVSFRIAESSPLTLLLPLDHGHTRYFDDQATVPIITEELTIDEGDVLQTTCVFNSMERTTNTIFNKETVDEMCFTQINSIHSTSDFVAAGGAFSCDGPVIQIINQNSATPGFEMCFAIGHQHLLVLGVPTKTRLESSIKKFKSHLIFD